VAGVSYAVHCIELAIEITNYLKLAEKNLFKSCIADTCFNKIRDNPLLSIQY